MAFDARIVRDVLDVNGFAVGGFFALNILALENAVADSESR